MGQDMRHEHFHGSDANLGVDLQPAAASPDRRCVELIVKRLISERRQRGAFFPGELFADPAWELLLALTLVQAQERKTSVTQLCNQVDVPGSTAVRWIARLTEQGFFIRRDDATDKRRKYIELSSHAYATMVAYCTVTPAATPRGE